MATMHEASGLVKALNAVAAGTMQVQDFSRVVVAAAVEDTLLRVSQDYGLNYKELLARYKEDVVTHHVTLAAVASTQGAGAGCQGLTRTGKGCQKRAQIAGFCLSHADQWSSDETKKRCVEAYRHQVTTKKDATAALVQELNSKKVLKCKSANALTLL